MGGSEFAGDLDRMVRWVRESRHAQHGRLVKAIMDRRELLNALEALTDNVQDYEPWQRPCLALENAKAAIAKATGGAHV
jgi:hypothetical protein